MTYLCRHDVDYAKSFCSLNRTFILIREFKSICRLSIEKSDIYRTKHVDSSTKWDSNSLVPIDEGTGSGFRSR